MNIDKRRLYHLDWYLIINGLAILLVGLINLISATRSIEVGPYMLFIKQLVAVFIGIILIAVITAHDYRLIAGYSNTGT